VKGCALLQGSHWWGDVSGGMKGRAWGSGMCRRRGCGVSRGTSRCVTTRLVVVFM
jgi:hypothetical protein